MKMQLHPLGALSSFVLLFYCVAGVLAGKSNDTVYDYRGGREDTRKIGEVLKSFRQTSSHAVYLPLTMPSDGILYKFKVFLVSTDPVFIQLWRPSRDTRNEFILLDQIKVQSNKVNVTRTFYPVRLNDDGSPKCPVVRQDDKLGLFGTTSRLAIPIYFDTDKYYMLAERRDSSMPLSPGITLDFSEVLFPYAFSIEAFVYRENLRRQSQRSTDYRPCPLKLMPKYSTTTYTTTTEISHETLSVTPSTEPTSQVSYQPTAAEDDGTSSAEVLHIAVGSLAGVAVIAIIGVVILALYCRRRHQSDGLKPAAGGATPANNKLTGPTMNPAYGINCEFLNNYETPNVIRPQSTESHGYRPVIPPRPTLPEAENRNSGTYEEIMETGSKRSGKREAASDHVTPTEQDYELYGTPEYESLRPDVRNGKPIGTNDVVVLDGVNAEPEVGSGREDTSDYLDLVPDANSSTYVL